MDRLLKIKTISIKNFRSLKDIHMNEIGDLTTIIGPNSAGKSNLLEALDLFFSQFDSAPQRSLGGIYADYIWHDKDTSNPIEIALRFEISKKEVEKLIPKNFFKQLPDQNYLTIVRKIYGPAQNAIIKTTAVFLGEQALYSDDKSPLPPPPPPPQPQGLPPPPPTPPPQIDQQAGELLRNLHSQFQKTFKIIPSTRNFLNPTPAGQRTSTIQPNILQELTQMGNTLGTTSEKRWNEIEDTITDTSQEITDVRVIAGQLTVKEKENRARFPLFLIGGGNQELFTLAHQLTDEFTIYGIEEPETHLHPHLARRLFDIFKETSKANQLIITTHSTVFIDQSELENTWIVSKRNKETKIEKLENAETLQNLLSDLGIRPSDIFYSNAILFVEGPVDKKVYSELARKLNINFDEYGLSVIPIRGSGSGKYHLSVWLEAVKNTKLPFFMILDKDAHKEAEQLIKEKILKKDQNLFLLNKGPIENYYPPDTIFQAIKNVYEFDVSEDEKSDIKKNFVSQIPTILEKHGKDNIGWKFLLGEEISKMMKSDEVDTELQTIFERIRSKLE